MTRDEIAKMARKTGFTIHTDDSVYMEMLHNFAALVAAAEREACANIVENADTPDCGGWSAQGIADDIRARSQQ